MPPSLFNNLAASLRETESLLTTKRALYARLLTRHDTLLQSAPARAARLHRLSRQNADLLKRQRECRRRIAEETRKLRGYEEEMREGGRMAEGLQGEVVEAGALRGRLVGLGEEIVVVDGEVEAFKQMARRIVGRARGGDGGCGGGSVYVVGVGEGEMLAEGVEWQDSTVPLRPEKDLEGLVDVRRADHGLPTPASTPHQTYRQRFVLEVPSRRRFSPEPEEGDGVVSSKRTKVFRKCFLAPSMEVS